MLDFLIVSTRVGKNKVTEIYPKFLIKKSKDLMIRGGDFYAVWYEDKGLWSTNEDDLIFLIDREIKKFVDEHKAGLDNYHALYMWDSDSGVIDKWHKYCQKQTRDNFIMLDETIIFSNDPVRKENYASKRLPYPLERGDHFSWDKIVGTLYSEEERHKIEWAIGAVVTGASKELQKFMVFYGAAGTGKSTIMNILQDMFDGYYSVFDAKALGSSSNQFALEAFKHNPLVAIQHDGDLSRIEDNCRINSLVSHELMTVNEKFKSGYENRFKAFLFMGTNKPVKITDAKSGLIRRLIDVIPSGNKLSRADYNKCTKQVKFELGAIAEHCKSVFEEDPFYYDSYIPTAMLGSTNDFYNFVEYNSDTFERERGITLQSAWALYKEYVEDARVPYPLSQRAFKEELKNYFKKYEERHTMSTGVRVRSFYTDFCLDKFDNLETEKSPGGKLEEAKWLDLKEQPSIFDKEMENCPAQYANKYEIPKCSWDKVTTTLKDIDTSKLHYAKIQTLQPTHIVVDFDLKNEKGEKDYDANVTAASLWPPTYAEVSKGGAGIHLHYLYSGGDVSRLSRIFAPDIEIKVFTGDSTLRRKLSKCNDLQIATLSSGLPLKEEKMVNFDGVTNEKGIRTSIIKALNKEVHSNTKCNMDFIFKVLDDAYTSGVKYDVSDMEQAVLTFATNSSHQSEYCLKIFNDMHFKSEEPSDPMKSKSNEFVFFDCEVFPNLFLINYKFAGSNKPVVRLINPTPEDIEQLIRYRLIGFNCRRYDNHMLYGRLMGYTNEQLYNLSQRIVNSSKGSVGVFFGEAYNLSYTDVYDFASSGNKQSLKKFEILLQNKGLLPSGHHELGLPWDKPVPEELWEKVAEYCDDDVLATEATFNYLKADWTARQILASLANGCPNDTTNSLTTKIIFGNNRKPQDEFCYRDLSKPCLDLTEEQHAFLSEACPEMMEKTHGEAGSLLPYFPGYTYSYGKSYYRDELVGEGGFAQGFPGMYFNVALLDVSSMHPHSLIAEILFGIRYTKAFRDIVEGRVSIKHEAWDEVNHMLEGKLTPFIQKVIDGEMTSKDLANALKTAINSVYGLTSAKFENPFKDERNIDNIVAKRGALFMIDLKHAVLEKGFKVAHIKTDSIKIPDATPDIIKFVMDFGKRYGYTFEHEATYERMTLVNDAVYIAKYAQTDECQKMYGYVPDDNKKEGGEWTATGTQFQVPYVFKTLFSKEPIEFADMCETKSVTTALYLDRNEALPDVSYYEKELVKREKEFKDNKITEMQYGEAKNILSEEITKGHNYIFVGKVGQFCPIKPGCGGAELVAQRGDKYSSATGAKGYRWLESDMVKELDKEADIDLSYYNKMVDDAVATISQYGDFEAFVA